MKMTCLLIDDERLARIELRHMLDNFPEFDILGEAKNAQEAESMIEQLRPDFIFLDIQMPGASGFDLLHRLPSQPLVIFVTAFDQYAIKAFEHHAIDYLLKPISAERLQKSLERIGGLLKNETGKQQKYLAQIFLPSGKQIQLIQAAEICHILSIGNYAQIHTKATKGLIKTSLTLLEKQLNPALFFRINRSEMINIQQIEKAWTEHKIIKVLLNNEVTLQMSERKSVEFKRKVKI